MKNFNSAYELYRWLGPLSSDMDIVIQLPDNEAPVQFTAEVIDGTVVLFPIPRHQGHIWDHDNNVIKSGPVVIKNGRLDK